jgi:hypothetical protein
MADVYHAAKVWVKTEITIERDISGRQDARRSPDHDWIDR